MSDAGSRLPKALLALLLFAVLPTLLAARLAGSRGATAFVIGMVLAFLASLSAGWPGTRRLLPVLAGAYLLGGLVSGTWWWAVAAALLAAAAGYAVRWAMMPPLAVSGLALLVAPRFDDPGQAAAAGCFVLLGAVLGVALARRAGAPASPRQPAEPERVARLTAVAVGVAVGAAAACALVWDQPQAYWAPMTVLIVAQPAAEGRGARARMRIVGTLLACLVALPLAAAHLPTAVTGVLAAAFLLLTIAVPRPYWLTTFFGTMLVILALTPRDGTLVVAERRVLGTVVGIVLLAGAAWAAVALDRRGRARLSLPARDT